MPRTRPFFAASARELHARIAAVLEERFPGSSRSAARAAGAPLHRSRIDRTSRDLLGQSRPAIAARSAMVEAEAQLRRGLLLLSDLPDSRDRKRQELDLQVTLASALRESKGHVHPLGSRVLGRARSLIAETEATGTILHFSVLYGLWVAQYLGGERIAALAAGQGILVTRPIPDAVGIAAGRPSARRLGAALHRELSGGVFSPRSRDGCCTGPKSTGSLRSDLVRTLALPLSVSGHGHFGTAGIPIRREEP